MPIKRAIMQMFQKKLILFAFVRLNISAPSLNIFFLNRHFNSKKKYQKIFCIKCKHLIRKYETYNSRSCFKLKIFVITRRAIKSLHRRPETNPNEKNVNEVRRQVKIFFPPSRCKYSISAIVHDLLFKQHKRYKNKTPLNVN